VAEPTPPEPQSLEAMLAQEDKEINALLKQSGLEIPGDDLIADGKVEVQPPPTQTDEPILETAEPEPTPEPEPEPKIEPEPKTEPTPEPEKPPLEVKPEPEKKERVPIWKALRDSERRLKDLEAENARLKSEREVAAKQSRDEFTDDGTPTELDEDPITKVQKEQEKISAQLANQAEAIRQRNIADSIKTDEERFKKDHPDYEPALGHIVVRARERFGLTGDLEDKMQEVLKNNQDVIERVMTMKGIRDPSDDDVYKTAEDIAFAVLFEQERQRFVQRQMARGKSVAQAAYELACSEGWTPQSGDPAPEPVAAPVAAKTETPQQKVARQAKIAVAGQSLAALQNGGPTKGEIVSSKSDFIKMSPQDQDKFIARMEQVDPDWLQKLPD